MRAAGCLQESLQVDQRLTTWYQTMEHWACDRAELPMPERSKFLGRGRALEMNRVNLVEKSQVCGATQQDAIAVASLPLRARVWHMLSTFVERMAKGSAAKRQRAAGHLDSCLSQDPDVQIALAAGPQHLTRKLEAKIVQAIICVGQGQEAEATLSNQVLAMTRREHAADRRQALLGFREWIARAIADSVGVAHRWANAVNKPQVVAVASRSLACGPAQILQKETLPWLAEWQASQDKGDIP